MNTSSSVHLSLFQLVEEYPAPIQIQFPLLANLVTSLIDALVEQQTGATLWMKMPLQESWLPEIERYLQQVSVPSPIYLCDTDSLSEPAQSMIERYPQRLSAMQLGVTSSPAEYFFIVRSPQWNGLILAEEVPESNHLKVICSFDPAVVKRILIRINQVVVSSSFNTTVTQIGISPTQYPEPSLFTTLLLKQLQRIEENSRPTFSPSSHSQEFLHHLIQEISTPLTHMKTALSLLESKTMRISQRQRYFELLHRECERQNSLITGLKELFYINQSDANEITSSEDLDELIPSIVSTYQPLASEKGILLGYTVPPNLPAVACPANWIKQIIIHLLNNSLNFTPSQGQVLVLVSVQEEYLQIHCKDTGVGILANDISKVFDSFYRKPSKLNQNSIGAGLGLSIVQQLLERCGGTISVSSQPSKGSSFKVLLPLAPTS